MRYRLLLFIGHIILNMTYIIAIYGGGKIGEAICALLCASKKYSVRIFDNNPDNIKKLQQKWQNKFSLIGKTFEVDTTNLEDEKLVFKQLDNCFSVISALPFFCNTKLAGYASKAQVHYFDLTEDVETTKTIKKIAATSKSPTIFMPQCGLAPGFISIAATSLIKDFESVETCKLRVGALPVYPSNRLKYNMTWSTDGLINEYGNSCELILDGKKQVALALEGEERFSLGGIEYEAFNTSGGLGTLCESQSGKVKNLNYKSVRYPGHLEYIRFLMHDLKFNDYRDELKNILERAIPTTKQDKTLIYVEVTGIKSGKLYQETFSKIVFHKNICDEELGAIQITTAAGILAPIDLLANGEIDTKAGFRMIEEIPLSLFLKNEFGAYYGN